MAYTEQDYINEAAICARAARYAESVMCEGGASRKRNYLTEDEAAHPDYAACDNDMRGRVEFYELMRDKPEQFFAYVSSDGKNITTWTGLFLGTVSLGAGWHVNSYISNRMYQVTARVFGRTYTGRTMGAGMCANLRETAQSKRDRRA
jgi:hypothetical protein